MCDYLMHEGTLDLVKGGFCFWRDPKSRLVTVTDILLNEIIDSSDILGDVSGGRFGMSLVGGRFLTCSAEQKKTIIRKTSDINSVSIVEGESLTFPVELYSDSNSAYFRNGAGVFNLRYEPASIDFLFVIEDAAVFISYFDGGVLFATRKGQVEHRSWDGSTLWVVDVIQILLDAGKRLSEVEYTSRLIGSYVLIHFSNNDIICLNAVDGSIRWHLDNAFTGEWDFCLKDQIAGFQNSSIRMIDLSSGAIVSERPIDPDWATSNLRLYKASATHTHLWAGFFGRGLCAINLENGKIDYHVFDGGTCDSNPKILNNRIFVAIRKGGLGLESNRQEYILEGHGDYKPDADGFFEIP